MDRLTDCSSGVENAPDDALRLCRGFGEKILARPPYSLRASLVPPNNAALINYNRPPSAAQLTQPVDFTSMVWYSIVEPSVPLDTV